MTQENPESLEDALGRVEDLRRDLSRKETRAELQKIYNSSEWYSARYKAGISLGMDAKKLSCDAHSWLPDIRRRLRAEKTQEIVNAATYENEEVKTGKIVDGVPETRNIVVLKPKANKIAFADREKRLMALKDAARLYEISRMGILEEILQDTYLNNNCRDVRIQAGRYLGHSKIRVTLGEFYRGAFKQQPPPYTHP